MPPFRHKNNLAIAAILFATILLTDALVGTTPLYALAALAAVTMLLWCYLIDAAVWGLKVLIGADEEGK